MGWGLQDIYRVEGPRGLRILAYKVDCHPHYLWNCATGRREPSPEMARKLIAADPRLSLDGIYAARSLNYTRTA